MILDADFWTQMWSDLAATAAIWLPRVAGALLLLIVGWLVARFLRALLGGLFRRLGLDKLAERAGISRLLTQAGLDSSVAYLTARLIYWIVLLVFLIAASESLGLPGVGETLGRLVAYLPNLFAGALIILLGSALGRVAGDVLTTFSLRAEIASAEALGLVVRYIIIAFSAILALEQLGIETTLLISTALAIVGGSVLALSLGFGLGSRELTRNIMSGYHVKDAFQVGQQIQVRGHSGRLVNIGPVKSTIATVDGEITSPNSILIEEEVTVMKTEEDGP